MTSADTSLKQNTVFLKNTFKKSIFASMLSILSANINVFVDGILVGNRLGSNALAAINLSLPVYLVPCIIGSFISSGTAINAARAIGNDDSERSQLYYSSAVISSFIVSIFVTILGLAFRKSVVSFLCSDADISPYVMQYAVVTIIGALPKIMLYIPFWYLRLDGKNSSVALIMAVMSVGNIILDVLFVYIWNMGVLGAAAASVIATSAALIVGIFILTRKDCAFRFKPFMFTKPAQWSPIFVAGTPSALSNLLSTLRLLLINSILMSYGGGSMVAVFTAVNGIAGFGECITLGIPQASSAMLGVFSGEHDNGSCRLLIKLELIVGTVYSAVFLLICTVASEPIRMMYGLQESMLIPLFWLSLSLFPGVLCTVVSGYYNMSGKNIWASGIIFLRFIVMTYLALITVTRLHFSVYSFIFISEAAAAVVWFVLTGIYHRSHPDETRYLLMDMSLEKRGNVLNFSVSADNESICDASERIMEFCENNGMDMKKTMRIQLAMEEIMTLITSVNASDSASQLSFDLRAYSLENITGIRIRYGGKEFDPFRSAQDSDEMYMGIIMIKKMVQSIRYQKTFGVNTLQVIINKE